MGSTSSSNQNKSPGEICQGCHRNHQIEKRIGEICAGTMFPQREKKNVFMRWKDYQSWSKSGIHNSHTIWSRLTRSTPNDEELEVKLGQEIYLRFFLWKFRPWSKGRNWASWWGRIRILLVGLRQCLQVTVQLQNTSTFSLLWCKIRSSSAKFTTEIRLAEEYWNWNMFDCWEWQICGLVPSLWIIIRQSIDWLLKLKNC